MICCSLSYGIFEVNLSLFLDNQEKNLKCLDHRNNFYFLVQCLDKPR